MQFSEQWLRSWVNPTLNTEALSHLLTMAGLEVEEISPAAPLFSGVVIAEVKALVPHENADRLRVAQVDVGSSELVKIVCGAANVAIGLKVPCALPGAVLPGDFRIKPTKMRGVPSNGMLCSGKELGVPDAIDGLLVLPADAPVGLSIRDFLALDDMLLTLKITPNRADCLSIRGIAREVAALTGAELRPAAIQPVMPRDDSVLPITIEAGQACGRYLGRMISDINAAAATPDWMIRRLERSGLRPVSAVVDITNYILLEQGQPMHAFDAAAIHGGIRVRAAREGETLVCLNEKEVSLHPDILVIADNERPLAIAGIMGGLDSAVQTTSRDIFLESAFFAPQAIAGRARQLGFGSDSSFRYERGVDYKLQHAAMERATELMVSICGGRPGPVREVIGELPREGVVRVRTERLNRLLGVSLHTDAIAGMLRRLGLECAPMSGGLMVNVPSFRFDIAIEEDLIEEVARMVGYDNIGVNAPQAALGMLPLPETARSRQLLCQQVAMRDYQEVVTYAFVDERWEAELAANAHPVKLLNPIAAQMSVMRSSLFGGLLNVLENNLNRKQPRVRLFEMARVFLQQEGVLTQPERLGLLAWGPRVAEQWAQKSERVDFFDLKGDIEALLHPRQATFVKASHPALHPGRCADIVIDGQIVGVIGELHPQWVQARGLSAAPVLAEVDLAILLQRERIQASQISKFQAVRRDLALVVDQQIEVVALLSSFAAVKSPIVSKIALFDVYCGPGVDADKKSLAFSVQLQDSSRTLTDEEVEETMARLLTAVVDAHGASLRL